MATNENPTQGFLNIFDGESIVVTLQDGQFKVGIAGNIGTFPMDELVITNCGDRPEWRKAKGY